MTNLQPTPIDQIEDADPNDLVVRARGGCEESYAELVRRYFPRLVQLILPRVTRSNHMDAEDIAQESLTRAFQKLDTFDPRYRFSTWLYTIAIRIAMDHNRGTRRRLTILETHRSLFEASPMMSSWFIPCAGASRPKGNTLAPTPSTAQRIRSLFLTRDHAPDESAVAIYEHVWFSRAEVDG